MLDAAAGGPNIRLAVRDTGCGIPRDQQARVFESFTQVEGDPEQATQGGSGLGLTICRRLVELMHGRIGLESAPGQGSTFWVELPLAAAPLANPAAIEPAADAGDAPLDTHLRVLLVEDHEVSRQVAAAMIERLGCQVDSAASGGEALEALERAGYDVVLMDIQLPGLNGLGATAELRRREAATGRHVPVIALTASAMTEDRQRCLEAGMDDYLAKPLRSAALRAALVRWSRAGSNPLLSEDPPGTAPALADAGQSFDRSVLEECCGSNPALIADVLETFLHATPASLSAVAAAVSSASAGDLQREAHRLKGACQTIGAGALAADCTTLLTLAREGTLGNAQSAEQALRDRWERLRADVGEYLSVLRNG